MEQLSPGTRLDPGDIRTQGAAHREAIVIDRDEAECPYGAWYRAKQGGNELLVTLLDPAVAMHAELRSMLMRDVAKARGVRHKNLLTVHGIAEYGPTLYVVRDAPDGLSLRRFIHKRLARGKSVDLKTAYTLIAHVCNALATLHRTMLHEYVSADTVYVSQAGRVLVGSAGEGGVLVRAPGFARFRAAGLLPCVAPEQLGPAPKPVLGTDVFGVATLMIELLTGQALMEAGQPLRDLGFQGPLDLLETLERATAPSQEARPPSVGDLKSELQRAIEGASGRVSGVPTPPPHLPSGAYEPARDERWGSAPQMYGGPPPPPMPGYAGAGPQGPGMGYGAPPPPPGVPQALGNNSGIFVPHPHQAGYAPGPPPGWQGQPAYPPGYGAPGMPPGYGPPGMPPGYGPPGTPGSYVGMPPSPHLPGAPPPGGMPPAPAGYGLPPGPPGFGPGGPAAGYGGGTDLAALSAAADALMRAAEDGAAADALTDHMGDMVAAAEQARTAAPAPRLPQAPSGPPPRPRDGERGTSYGLDSTAVQRAVEAMAVIEDDDSGVLAVTDPEAAATPAARGLSTRVLGAMAADAGIVGSSLARKAGPQDPRSIELRTDLADDSRAPAAQRAAPARPAVAMDDALALDLPALDAPVLGGPPGSGSGRPGGVPGQGGTGAGVPGLVLDDHSSVRLRANQTGRSGFAAPLVGAGGTGPIDLGLAPGERRASGVRGGGLTASPFHPGGDEGIPLPAFDGMPGARSAPTPASPIASVRPASADAREYIVQRDGVDLGPFSLRELAQRVKAREFSSALKFRHNPSRNVGLLVDIPELRVVFQALAQEDDRARMPAPVAGVRAPMGASAPGARGGSVWGTLGIIFVILAGFGAVAWVIVQRAAHGS